MCWSEDVAGLTMLVYWPEDVAGLRILLSEAVAL